MTKNIVDIYHTEVWRVRAGNAVIWSVLLASLAYTASLFCVNVSFIHPIAYFYGEFSSWLTIYRWMMVGCFLCVTLAISGTQASYFTVRPVLFKNRWDHIMYFFGISRNLFAIKHMIASVVIVWTLLSHLPKQYRLRSETCEAEGREVSQPSSLSSLQCLNTRHHFMLMSGVYVGYITAMYYYKYSQQIQFPIIQQSEFFEIKRLMSSTVKSAVAQAIKQTSSFYVLYVLLIGPYGAPIASVFLSLHDRQWGCLDYVYQMLDFSLLWYIIVSTSLLNITYQLIAMVHTTYQSQAVQFSVDGDKDSELVLSEAVGCTQSPIIQYLAYRDLSELSSTKCFHRRRVIFSLSQPGGHPHNWTAISTHCLDTLTRLIDNLTVHNNHLSSAIRHTQISGDRKINLFNNNDSNNSSLFHRSALNSSVATPGPSSQNSATPKNGTIAANYTKPGSKPVKTFSQKLAERFYRIKVVSYLVTDHPHTQTCDVFTDCQVYTYAVRALSYLACRSYTEDTYGVVQSRLPDIVTVLLVLNEAMDRHMKLAGGSLSRAGTLEEHTIKLRSELRAAVKTGLYHLVDTFNKHLLVINLQPEHQKKLKLFMAYRE